ncbi:hypothetical protein GW916_11380 [bacterium]|nr:hypothetical protein [bacterium]
MKSIFVFLFVIGASSTALAFNDLSCASQAKMLAESVTMSQVGDSYSKYSVTYERSAQDSEYDRSFTYRAAIPGDSNSMSLQINMKFSDYSEGRNNSQTVQKQCYLNSIEIFGAG